MRTHLKCLVAIASVASALAIALNHAPAADIAKPATAQECFRERCEAVLPKEARQVRELGSFRDKTNIGTARAPLVAPAPLTVTGIAHVLDGDTIEIDGQRIRLEGIDAPEGGQRCNRRVFGEWSCGTAATYALIGLVQGRQVTCEHRGTDKYARMLGICATEGRDINAEMVRLGLAWAYVKYSTAYVAVEAEAREARRGVWVASTMPPWEFRARYKGQMPTAHASAEQPADASRATECNIKGNVTTIGRIYHLPTSPWYGRIVMDTAKGRRWFCSEGEAIAAGWRPAWRM